MNQLTYNSLKSFIWGIANDWLVDVRNISIPDYVIIEEAEDEESDDEEE